MDDISCSSPSLLSFFTLSLFTSSFCPRAPSSQWPAWSGVRRGRVCDRVPPWCHAEPETIRPDGQDAFEANWSVPGDRERETEKDNVNSIEPSCVCVCVCVWWTHLQFPCALGILAPRVGGHEGPLGEAITMIIIIGASWQNHGSGQRD